MKKILLVLSAIFSFTLFADDFKPEEYVKGEITSLINSEVVTDDNEILRNDYYQIEVLEGTEKGQNVIVEFPIFKEQAYNINIRVGQKVVLYREFDEYGFTNYFIIDVDKRSYEIGLILLFVGLTIAIAKFKGVQALISLALVIFIIFKIFFPLILDGHSPIIVASFCAILSSIITIFLMTKFSHKGIVAILGSVIGVTIAGIISYFFANKMSLTGYVSVEALNYASLLKNIKVKELISAGVILGSMGAVMDVAMSISSALTELRANAPELSDKEIFNSGMRIGRDIIGTMVNTLILAYIGSGILNTLFLYLQQDQFPLIRILNFESIAEDIIRAFAGSIGILVSVPVTSYLSTIFKYKEKAVR